MFKALSPAGFFIIVMIYFLTLFGLSVMASTLDIDTSITDEQFLFSFKIKQALGVIMIFMVPACILVLLFTSEKLHYFLIHKAPSFWFVVISSALIIVALPLIGYLEEINKAITLPVSFSGLETWMKSSEAKAQFIEDALMKELGLGNLMMNLFVIAFMAALSEELFFRGLIQQALLKLTKNIHWAIWITAILFSAFHLQFYGFIPRVVLGAILGYIFVWSGSLWTSIIVHFINNAVVLIMTYLMNTGRLPRAIQEIGMEGDKVTLSWALSGTFLVIACMYLLNKMRTPNL